MKRRLPTELTQSLENDVRPVCAKFEADLDVKCQVVDRRVFPKLEYGEITLRWETSRSQKLVFEAAAPHFGFQESDFGRVFEHKGKKWQICGYTEHHKKNLFLAHEVGRPLTQCRFPLDFIRERLK